MSSELPAVLKVGGIDVGSSSVKVALMEEPEGKSAKLMVGRDERIGRRDPVAVAEGLFAGCLREVGWTREDLSYLATTGEGDMLDGRTGHFYGMTTHARGGLFLDPEARAIVDIGALHTRAVVMDKGAKVLGYRMTSQCASGSGQFLENICRYLGITIDDIGPLSLQSDDPERCSSVCAVLAETDVINMVSRGISAPNIIRGIHQSMAGRYLRLLASAKARGVVLVTGGLSRDVGIMRSLQESADQQKTPIQLRSHSKSVLAGALGAALWGAFRARKMAEKGISFEPKVPA